MSIFSIAGLRMTSESPQFPTKLQHRSTTTSSKVRSRMAENSDVIKCSHQIIETTTLDDPALGRLIPPTTRHARGVSGPVLSDFVAPPPLSAPPPLPPHQCPLNQPESTQSHGWPGFDWTAYQAYAQHNQQYHPSLQQHQASARNPKHSSMFPTFAYCFPFMPPQVPHAFRMCTIPANASMMPNPSFLPMMAHYPFIPAGAAYVSQMGPTEGANVAQHQSSGKKSPTLKSTYPPRPSSSACSNDSTSMPSCQSDVSSPTEVYPAWTQSCSKRACSVPVNYSASPDIVWMVPCIVS